LPYTEVGSPASGPTAPSDDRWDAENQLADDFLREVEIWKLQVRRSDAKPVSLQVLAIGVFHEVNRGYSNDCKGV